MPKGRKRRTEKYSVFEGGERIPTPDYAVFNSICSDVAYPLGLSAKDVRDLYVEFIDHSVGAALPEDRPRDLTDEQLLNPRRIIRIPKVASLEVTRKSLAHWRRVRERITAKKNTDINAQNTNNYAETEENNSDIQPHPDDEGPVQE